jgi:hypothetical protein
VSCHGQDRTSAAVVDNVKVNIAIFDVVVVEKDTHEAIGIRDVPSSRISWMRTGRRLTTQRYCEEGAVNHHGQYVKESVDAEIDAIKRPQPNILNTFCLVP